MQAVIFVGIQASGKTAFYLERFAATHVRISLDLLRTHHREQRFLGTCLETSQPFVVDNTNPKPEDRLRYTEPARAKRFRTIGYYFACPLERSLARNRRREGGTRIPDKGVLSAHKVLVIPRRDEFDELWYVRTGESGGFEVLEWNDEV